MTPSLLRNLSIALRVVAVVGAAAAIYGWIDTKGQIDQKNIQIADLSKKLTAKTAEAEKQAAEIVRLTSQNEDLIESVRQQKKRYEEIYQQYTKVKAQLAQAEEEVKNLGLQTRALNAQLTQLKSDFEQQVASKAKVDASTLQKYKETIKHLKEKEEDAKEKIAKLETTIIQRDAIKKGDKYIVEGPLAHLVGTTTSILISRPQEGFLILGWGKKDGLIEKMTFSISQPFGQPIRIRIAHAEEDHSLAYIYPSKSSPRFKKGDKVELVPELTREAEPEE